MKASTLDAPLQIHCEGKALLCVEDRGEGTLTIYAAHDVPLALVRFTHVHYALAAVAAEPDPEPKPKRSPRKRSPAVNHGSD